MMATVVLALFGIKCFASFIAASECKTGETTLANQKIFANVPGDGKS